MVDNIKTFQSGFFRRWLSCTPCSSIHLIRHSI